MQELEDFFRKNLQNRSEKPDPTSWADIAAQQRRRNWRLKARKYALYMTPAAAALVMLLVWQWGKLHWQPSAVEMPVAAETRAVPPDSQNSAPTISSGPVANVIAAPLSASKALFASNHWKDYQQWPEWRRCNTVRPELIKFRAETGLDYQNPASGNRVRIPAGALVHADGRPVRGEVEMLFCEYRSLGEILAGGMPMHYGDDRGEFHFNTAGMFEVRVAQRGAALRMAPGANYEVDFLPSADLSETSLYYLDDATGAWQCTSPTAFGSSAERGNLPPMVTEEAVRRENARNERYDGKCLPTGFQYPSSKSNPMEMTQRSVQTGYDLAFGKMEMPAWFRKNPDRRPEVYLAGLERSAVRLVRYRDRDEAFFPEDMQRFYTELSAFKDCYFVSAEDSLPKDKIERSAFWENMVVYQTGGVNVHITLYDSLGMIEFNAKLASSAENAAEKGFDPYKIMAEYKRLRDKRQNELAEKIMALKGFIQMAPMFQKESEWCMDNADWIEWFYQNLPAMRVRYDALVRAGIPEDEEVARRTYAQWLEKLMEFQKNRGAWARAKAAKTNNFAFTLQLSGFGMYNCDQIFRLSRRLEFVNAVFQDESGNLIQPSALSVVERLSRLVFTQNIRGKIYKLPGQLMDVVLYGNDKTYYIPAKTYAAMNFDQTDASGRVLFTVQDVTERVQTPGAWMEMLDL
ncbi:MAG: hypothetical protein ACR2K1_00735 [Saprospiraceae bacterium]